MEIKKPDKGNEYDLIVFTDEAAKSASLDSKGYTTSFGLFVTAYLKHSGRSIAKFATDLGVSRQTIFDWINAKSIPTRRNVEAIMALTSCSPETLQQALIDNFESQKTKLFENLAE